MLDARSHPSAGGIAAGDVRRHVLASRFFRGDRGRSLNIVFHPRFIAGACTSVAGRIAEACTRH
jgi:hypothetical protein